MKTDKLNLLLSLIVLAAVCAMTLLHLHRAVAAEEERRQDCDDDRAERGTPPQLSLESVNPRVREAAYAVRGPILLKAQEIERELRLGSKKYNFSSVVYCNIGNPQSLGQLPITFTRRVLSILLNPELLEVTNSAIFPTDVIQRAKRYLSFQAVGAYSESKGMEGIRKEIAQFIRERDVGGMTTTTGATPRTIPDPDPEDIYLTSGASQGVEFILKTLIRSPSDSILVPIPQYPLYSAMTTLLDGHFQGFELSEEGEWGLDVEVLEEALRESRGAGKTPRALVVINPGNPTGNTLGRETMDKIVEFCAREGLVLMADEVYQANVYERERRGFISFRRVVLESPHASEVQLVSFHSISKGLSGECGLRGGYFELVNFPTEVKAQILKLASIGLCPNTVGQYAMGLMVAPPREGDASFLQDVREKRAIFESLRRRAVKVVKVLNIMTGVSANPAEGAMYAFPRIDLPARFVREAAEAGVHPDAHYAMKLLLSTGVVVVPGSGFGQAKGTYHFRTTILPPEKDLDEVLRRMKEFHERLMSDYA